MNQKWFLLYSTRNLPQASIIKGMLEENSVPVMLVNKQDSSYLNFGDIEVYVPGVAKRHGKAFGRQGLAELEDDIRLSLHGIR